MPLQQSNALEFLSSVAERISPSGSPPTSISSSPVPLPKMSLKRISSEPSDEDKTKRRRQQIAEASRKSRARRKQQFSVMQSENEALWKRLNELQSKLQSLGEDAGPMPLRPTMAADYSNSDDEGAQPSSTIPASLESEVTSPRYPSTVRDVSPEITLAAKSPGGGGGGTGGLAVSELGSFFEARLQWYFSQLKADFMKSVGSNLSATDKAAICSLQTRIVTAGDARFSCSSILSAEEQVNRDLVRL